VAPQLGRRLPWAMAAFAVAIAVMEIVVSVQNSRITGGSGGLVDWLFPVAVFLVPFNFTAVGAFIVTRRPGNRIGWLMISLGLGSALSVFTSDYPGVREHGHELIRPFAAVVSWISAWIGVLYLLSLFLLLLVFPTGELPTRRWKPVLWMGLVGWGGVSLVSAVQKGPTNNGLTDNPFGIVSIPEAVSSLFILCGLAAWLCALLSLVLRFRSSSGVVREQLKWFTYGAVLAIAFALGGFATDWTNPVAALLSLTAIAAVPLFLGMAILRYRLYDIDVLINRTLVYGSLTLSLLVVYGLGVVSLQALFRVVVGQSSDLAIAIATLASVALFHPLRQRIQRFIDRRFYRRKYDATRALAAFGGRMRDEVELEQLSHDLLAVVQETVQPVHVSLWLRAQDTRV
jgi:hypothetical protein